MADLRRLRSDLGTFAAAVGVPLVGWQARSLTLDSRVTVIVAGRQLGKSLSLAVLALWWAYRTSTQRILIVSAGEEAAKRLLAEVRRIAASSPLLATSLVDEQAGLVTLSNGSEVRSVPASERQVRGWAVDLLLVDEAALVPDDLLLGAALPTTAARPDARVVMASSATTAEGAFFDFARQGETGSEHIETFKWIARAAGGPDDAPWVTPSFVAAARASMSELRFAAEFLADFAGGSDALLPRRILEAATVDYLTTPLAAFQPSARLLLGCDWGWSRDRSAAVALARFALPGAERVFGFATVQRWPAGHSTDAVIEEIAGSPAHFGLVVSESVGLGAPLTSRLFQRLAQRERTRGGGGPRRPVLVDAAQIFGPDWFRERRFQPPDVDWADGMVAAAPGLRARASGFRTRKETLHTSAASKQAAFATIRQLTERGQLLWPRGEEDLLREAVLLRVDLTPAGGERIEASSGHDDLVDALAAATWPRPPAQRGQPWRTYMASLVDRRKPLPDAPLPAGASLLPMVEAPNGLLVPRDPVWQTPDGCELTLPVSMPGPTEHDDLADVRDQVRAALANHTTKGHRNA